METKVSQSLQLSTWMNSEKTVRKPNGSLRFSQNCGEQHSYKTTISYHLPTRKGWSWQRPLVLKVSCSSENVPASMLESGSFPASFNETKILENKAKEIEQYLNGRCIYLVGMMGSGKTTVGKVLSEALGYSFYDCDTLIEQALGGTTVAEIFKSHGENFFRDNETEVLRKLSMMHRLVVSTGGGAVVRPINWRYMQKGISVWLDVPLEALARRITAVGTNSRPLLHHESGDPYLKTMKQLSTLFEERGEAYTNASARVSLENIAAKLRDTDVCNLTPAVIAIEVLEQIETLLKK
ncbi:shikimate kinase, chloroplastic [Olea europaea subsp. europaea]|uniref:shikimate kinase n=1 Tax=Olea europaea subsp. europaea TaxID=158383 RepID=A0A8S0RBC6_OLEEU|nr:shikimate kinase, chloroplastic [Olea europaea subsp. europaea]CAA2976076.1 shikimate kinase, chloroplastic [Olea europaea subsp. europaea]